MPGIYLGEYQAAQNLLRECRQDAGKYDEYLYMQDLTLLAGLSFLLNPLLLIRR